MEEQKKETLAVKAEDIKAIQYYRTTECGPCRMLEPLLEKVKAVIDVEYINVDLPENAGKAQEKGIKQSPTVIFDSQHGEVRLTGIPTIAPIFHKILAANE